MDWNTLLTFALGGLTAVIPIIIANRYQAREKDKDRVEQRKDAKAQLALELMRNDVKVIEDAILAVFEIFNILYLLSGRQEAGLMSMEEMVAEVHSMLTDKQGVFSRLAETDAITEMVALSLGNDIYLEHQKFSSMVGEYMRTLLDSRSDERKEIQDRLTISAAKLHNMLKDKLVSLRD